MLHLKTAHNERLEIPESAIIALMKPSDGVNPGALMFDMGGGPQIEQLADQYGHLKKMAIDSAAIVNPIEVRIIEAAAVGEGAEAMTAYREGRMFFSRLRIVGRREKKGDPNGVNAIVYVDLLGKAMALQVADDLEAIVPELPADPAIGSARNQVLNVIHVIRGVTGNINGEVARVAALVEPEGEA
ncbi:MAG: hypothetical protein QM605_02935 [Sphingobium sp.]